MEALTTTDQSNLAKYESIIESGLKTFYEVGNALLAIREEKLYRGTHGTFEGYCRDKWGISHTRAYELMGAAQVKDQVSAIADIKNEAQARPLTKVKTPEERRDIVKEVVDSGENITAKTIEKAVERRMPEQIYPVSDAMTYAKMAISQLERIRKDDPKRDDAFELVSEWIYENQ